MEARQILDALVGLAEEAGLRVRVGKGPSAPEGEPVPRSALCRVRGERWLVLFTSDAVEDRIRVVADALRRVAPELLEERYLPPAVRARVEEGPGAGGGEG
jgi:hypothetical protein